MWGANPHASAPHAHEYWLPEAPGQVIVIDPIRTPTAAQADIHLQPFPGSDAALAFALLHVIHRDGLIDEAFIAAHVPGWEELEPTIAACDLRKSSALTGVPAALIEQVAHLYATGPSLLWLGQGLQRQATGGNVMRACALLPAVTGNLCKPGAGFLYLNGNLRQRGMDEGYLTGAHLAAGAAPAISHMDFAKVLEDPARSRALFVWNMNPLASCPQQTRLRRALEREDLLTVALDLVSHRYHGAGRLRPAGGELPGIRRSDRVVFSFDAFRSSQGDAAHGRCAAESGDLPPLGAGHGLHGPELSESDADILSTLLARSGLDEDFASLGAKGTIWIPQEPAVQFADRSICDAERANRDRQRACRGRRAAAASAMLERSASGAGLSAFADAGARVAAQYEFRQCAANPRAAWAGEHRAAPCGRRRAAA